MRLEPVEKKNLVLAKGWRLIASKGERITKSGPWAPVTSFPTIYEAAAAVSVLSAAGIAAKIERAANVGILRSGFGGRAGSVTVLVPLTRLSEAQAILRGGVMV
jgi:hypothetical protein